MMRALFGLAALLSLLAGCAAIPVHEGAVNAARFPSGAVAPEANPPGRVALLVPPTVQGTVYLGEKLIGTTGNGRQVRVPIGQIVELAVLTGLGNALPGKVQTVVGAPSSGQGFSMTIAIDAVRFSYHEHTQFVLPVILPGVLPNLLFFTEVDTELAFDLRLLDAQGRVVLTRTYDAGRQIWKQPPGTRELSGDGVVRQAHDAAWLLARQATRDLLEGLALERSKPREL